MTRRAKERRQQRAADKQRDHDERLARERRLSARPEWRQLLRAIDGPLGGDKARGRSASVANELQWKSSNVPVAAAGNFQLPVKLDAPKGELRYSFSTRDYDVNFGVQMMCADGTMMEVLELRRYESQKQAVEGRFELAGPGMLLLLWDNSFSWVNPKQLSYTVELRQEMPPETAEEKAQLAQRARLERQKRILRTEANVDAMDVAVQAHEKGIADLQRQIQELQEKLEKKEAAKLAAMKTRDRLDEELDTLGWEIQALNWRCLEMPLIEQITDCLDDRSLASWSLTNKLWYYRLRPHQRKSQESTIVSDNQADDERQNAEPASD